MDERKNVQTGSLQAHWKIDKSCLPLSYTLGEIKKILNPLMQKGMKVAITSTSTRRVQAIHKGRSVLLSMIQSVQ